MARKPIVKTSQTISQLSLFDFGDSFDAAPVVQPPAPLNAPSFSETVHVTPVSLDDDVQPDDSTSDVIGTVVDNAETETVEHAAPHPVIPDDGIKHSPVAAAFNFPSDVADANYDEREKEKDELNPYLQFFINKKRIPKPVLPPYPYFGSKRKVKGIIWDMFGPDVYNYVEPFGGSLAVLLGRPLVNGKPSWLGKVETVNELNPYIVNFYRAAKYAPLQVAKWCDFPVYESDLHARHVWLVTQYKTGFKERVMRDPNYFDVQIAGWWVWGMAQWIGSGWCQIRDDGYIEDAEGELYDTLSDYGEGQPLNADERALLDQRLPHRGLPYMKSAGQGINGAVLDKDILNSAYEQVSSQSDQTPNGSPPSRKLPEMLGNRGIRRYTGDELNDEEVKVHRKLPILNHPVGIEATAQSKNSPPRSLPSIGHAGRGVTAYGRTNSETVTVGRSLPELNSPRGVERADLNGERSEIENLSRQIPMLSSSGQGITSLKRRAALVDYMMMLSDRLQTVRITCGDWSRVMGPSVTHGVGVTGVFLDPPYMTSSELYNGVKTNVTMEVLAWCKENWANPKLKIALCGYEGDMPVPVEWKCYEWKAPKGYQTTDNDGRTKERIWFNDACTDPNAARVVQQAFSFDE
jgi:site-specific DNA-adenine methylase